MSALPTDRLEFDPPSGLSFEPEFTGTPPREIPDELDEFTLSGSSEKHEQWSTPEELDAFTSDEAMVWVGEGRFGWPWVVRIVPADAAPPE